MQSHTSQKRQSDGHEDGQANPRGRQVHPAGKFSHALEQYLKAHQLNPGETTILNMIGDLYLRLGKEAEALLWYHKLADVSRSQELLSNASAAYKKILKLSPEDQDAMNALAKLYEEQGLGAKANQQYRLVAAGMVNRGEHDAAIAVYRKICSLEPASHEDQLRLAQGLEQVGNFEAASQAYLKAAQQLAQKGEISEAVAVSDNLLRIKPRGKNMLRGLFALLCQLGLTARGIDYLNLKSISLDSDTDFKVLISETLLREGKLDSAKAILLEDGGKDFNFYPVIVKLLQQLIARKDLDGVLEVAKAPFGSSVQRHDEITLKIMLDAVVRRQKSIAADS